MATSWQLSPAGELVPLTKTRDLLLDLVPVVEDLAVAHQELTGVVAEAVEIRQEARRLILRSRRQRLDLRLITT